MRLILTIFIMFILISINTFADIVPIPNTDTDKSQAAPGVSQ